MSNIPDFPRPRTLVEEMQRIGRRRLRPDTGWIYVDDEAAGQRAFNLGLLNEDLSPPFLNAWDNSVHPAPLCRFYLTAGGRVIVEGAPTGGTPGYDAGSALWQMPEGYRPQWTARRPYSADAGSGVGNIQVDPDGYVYLLS